MKENDYVHHTESEPLEPRTLIESEPFVLQQW